MHGASGFRTREVPVQGASTAIRRDLRRPDARRPRQGEGTGKHATKRCPVGPTMPENARTPPAEQAIFRLDFRNWLNTWKPKDREMINDLVLGERTADVASKHRITAGRVSQKRRQFRDDWERYCDEPPTEEDGRDFAA